MIARQFAGQTRNFKGQSFWARGYFVSTVGLDEQMVREYIRNQDERDKYFDQAELLTKLNCRFSDSNFAPFEGLNRFKTSSFLVVS